jgi:hypothetical protein
MTAPGTQPRPCGCRAQGRLAHPRRITRVSRGSARGRSIRATATIGPRDRPGSPATMPSASPALRLGHRAAARRADKPHSRPRPYSGMRSASSVRPPRPPLRQSRGSGRRLRSMLPRVCSIRLSRTHHKTCVRDLVSAFGQRLRRNGAVTHWTKNPYTTCAASAHTEPDNRHTPVAMINRSIPGLRRPDHVTFCRTPACRSTIRIRRSARRLGRRRGFLVACRTV